MNETSYSLKNRYNALLLHTNTKVNYHEGKSIVAINHFSKTYWSIQLFNFKEETAPINIAHTYFQWLMSMSKNSIKTKFSDGTYKIYAFFIKNPLLVLTLVEETENKAVFRVTGGLLAKSDQSGTFSFLRCKNNNYLIALEHFSPRLPWLVYKYTQAPIHEVVMKQFQKQRQGSKSV